MGFQGSMLGFEVPGWFFLVPGWIFTVPDGFLWLFIVPGRRRAVRRWEYPKRFSLDLYLSPTILLGFAGRLWPSVYYDNIMLTMVLMSSFLWIMILQRIIRMQSRQWGKGGERNPPVLAESSRGQPSHACAYRKQTNFYQETFQTHFCTWT